MQDFCLYILILIMGAVAFLFFKSTIAYSNKAKYEDSNKEFKKTIYYKNSLKNSKDESETSETDKV